MDLNLKGKVAIVTGAGRGIGKTTALTFCREGACVVIDDIDLEAAKLVEEEAKVSGAQALAVMADVTKIDEVRQMVRETLDKFGKIDILVNNAGILYSNNKGEAATLPRSFSEYNEDVWPAFINITLYGVLNCSRAVLETMLKQKSGSIINIASIAATDPHSPNANTYSAGKGGIIAFTKNLAYELGPSGIRVNCVSPGAIRTSRMEAVEAQADNRPELIKFYQNMQEAIKRIPLGRIGMPQEIANAVVFLASDASSYTTGQMLNVNGGQAMA